MRKILLPSLATVFLLIAVVGCTGTKQQQQQDSVTSIPIPAVPNFMYGPDLVWDAERYAATIGSVSLYLPEFSQWEGDEVILPWGLSSYLYLKETVGDAPLTVAVGVLKPAYSVEEEEDPVFSLFWFAEGLKDADESFIVETGVDEKECFGEYRFGSPSYNVFMKIGFGVLRITGPDNLSVVIVVGGNENKPTQDLFNKIVQQTCSLTG